MPRGRRIKVQELISPTQQLFFLALTGRDDNFIKNWFIYCCFASKLIIELAPVVNRSPLR